MIKLDKCLQSFNCLDEQVENSPKFEFFWIRCCIRVVDFFFVVYPLLQVKH